MKGTGEAPRGSQCSFDLLYHLRPRPKPLFMTAAFTGVFIFLGLLVVRSLEGFFWGTDKKYKPSGQNDPAVWGRFPDGDTTLEYRFSVFNNHRMILDLIAPQAGKASVEGDAPVAVGQSTRQSPSTRNRKRLLQGVTEAALGSLAAQAAKMATAVQNSADQSELTTLSKTLKILNDAGADAGLIKTAEDCLRQALSPQRLPVGPAPAGGQVSVEQEPATHVISGIEGGSTAE